MTIELNLDVDPFIEENPERFMELLRGTLAQFISENFHEQVNGFELAIVENPISGRICWNCCDTTDSDEAKCYSCGARATES